MMNLLRLIYRNWPSALVGFLLGWCAMEGITRA